MFDNSLEGGELGDSVDGRTLPTIDGLNDGYIDGWENLDGTDEANDVGNFEGRGEVGFDDEICNIEGAIDGDDDGLTDGTEESKLNM